MFHILAWHKNINKEYGAHQAFYTLLHSISNEIEKSELKLRQLMSRVRLGRERQKYKELNERLCALYDKYESKKSSMTAVKFLRAASYLAGCQGCIDVCEGKVSLFVGLQFRQAIIVSTWCEVVNCAHLSIQLNFFC